jgi:hypothetical protein
LKTSQLLLQSSFLRIFHRFSLHEFSKVSLLDPKHCSAQSILVTANDTVDEGGRDGGEVN